MFFFLIICRPPQSTLFPYTTLFRSLESRYGELMLRRGAVAGLLACAIGGVVGAQESADALRDEIPKRNRDRKSTRLNSSHSSISYAVFCLKKKKKKDKHILNAQKLK